ncbi:MAG: alanine racemase [Anaerolineales bacterium]|nr:alanine racemase [Anaerolineales bacterium]
MLPLTWLEIDLEAIRANVRRMAALTGTRVMAIVKANAYGHGAPAVAQAAAEAGAAWLGVARADEGLALRAAGLGLPILVLGHTPPALAAEALSQDLTLTVVEAEAGQAYAAAAQALGRPARVHLKVDTGMGRLGVRPEAAPELYRALRALPGLEVEGVFTHFARADEALAETDGLTAARQLARFTEVLQALEAPPALRHAANSAAALTLPGARLDFVRMGIALYGLHPSPDVPCPPGFRPVLTWKAQVAQVKSLPAGHGISYGHYYVTQAPETVAIVTVGYADGYRRALHINEVLIHGQRAPVRGRVCMDQIIVGVTHLPGVRPGDEAVLLGEQAGPDGRVEALTADDLAEKWKTINYDVTSGILPRVARLSR